MHSEILVGQKCRPLNSKPPASTAKPEDYFYIVVATWIEKCDTISQRHILMCAVVSDMTGGTNILSFLDLEFSDIEVI